LSRRIGPVTGTAVFLAACALAVPLLIAAQTLALPAQAPALLVCTAVLFYAAHPLGHAIFARRYGVPVDHFYLGRTDFRRILPVARRLPTVGTRLGIAQLAELSPERRGLIFGGGVITVCVVLALELGYVLAGR